MAASQSPLQYTVGIRHSPSIGKPVYAATADGARKFLDVLFFFATQPLRIIPQAVFCYTVCRD